MTNAELAAHIAELADLMALDGADAYRVSHYRKAATALRRFHHPLAGMIRAGTDLSTVPGIGKGLATLLADLVRQGSSPRLDEYRTRIPAEVVALMRLDGVGATRARTLRDAGVDSVAKLEAALVSREIPGLDGFGPGVVSRLKRGLEARGVLRRSSLLFRADRAAERVIEVLVKSDIEFRIAGEVRRRTETVTTVDVVCATPADALPDLAAGIPGIRTKGSRGDNPLHLILDGVRIRLVAAPWQLLEAIAHHLTGPPEYLKALATRASERGLELTPAGIAGSAGAGTHRAAGREGAGPGARAIRAAATEAASAGATATEATATEADLYNALALPWIAPELREDATTIERAKAGLPSLVTDGNIRGDLHMHTTWSDGAATLDRMAEASLSRGYRYIAITDHSPSTRVTGGLDGPALRLQSAEIARVQNGLPDIHILRGCEVDILPNGSLDIEDEFLAELDLVLVSVHSSFEMPEARMTDRIIRALENPFVHILCHPTGRKLGRRPPYPVDLDEVLRAAAALNVAVEINANPRRLDLDWRGLRLCGELGVMVVASSDAHSVASLDNMRYGVDQARRGWLRPDQILNAATLAALREWTARRRA
ncbi:MAG: PHP domain-containing protein [Gemmatimonadota bacterium]|nr:PHP domain-containing protein [Gemmatimonadota bacterium]